MKLFRSQIVFLVLLSIYSNTYSQTITHNFPDTKLYGKGKIYFLDNKRLEVRKLMIKGDQLTFSKKNDSKRYHHDLTDIYIVKVKTGTRARQYALYGALAFGISSMFAAVQAQSLDLEGDVNEGAFIFGFTVGGAALGALIGATQQKWKTLFVNEKTSSTNIHFELYPLVQTQPHYLGLNVNLIF